VASDISSSHAFYCQTLLSTSHGFGTPTLKYQGPSKAKNYKAYGYFTCGIWKIENFKTKYMPELEESSASKSEDEDLIDENGSSEPNRSHLYRVEEENNQSASI